MSKTNFVIPIFIPHIGCPFKCVFCDQKKITGVDSVPSEKDVSNIIEKYLVTIGNRAINLLVGFYGGNFTGIDITLQEKYLKTVKKYLDMGKINGIRISTRPDCIDNSLLSFLKKNGVCQIELGIQSFDDETLRLSSRGYTSQQAIDSSILIRERGFLLGHQHMVGLPGDDWQKLILSGLISVKLMPDMVRVYPALVIKDTDLANLDGYKPLSLDDAIDKTAFLIELFEKHNINILRVGLHPPSDKSIILAGPYHPAFRFMVKSRVWGWFINKIVSCYNGIPDKIYVSDSDYDFAVGYKKENLTLLANKSEIIKAGWIDKDKLLAKFGQVSKFYNRKRFVEDYLYFKINDNIW